jgi:hypothetical protein
VFCRRQEHTPMRNGARTDTGGSLPLSVVGIDPSGLVADSLARGKHSDWL